MARCPANFDGRGAWPQGRRAPPNRHHGAFAHGHPVVPPLTRTAPQVNRTRVEVDGSSLTYAVPVVYVADHGNSRVQMMRLSDGTHMKSFGSLGPGYNELDHPEGLFLHEEKLYVVDRGNHRIVVLDPELEWLFEFGSYGLGHGQFDYPVHVSVYKGSIWVSDRDAAVRVQNFHMNGTFLKSMRSGGGPV